MFEQLSDLINNVGLNSKIYNYFWSSSSMFGKRSLCSLVNCVIVPHTIIFDRNKPIEWFYFSLSEAEMKKKPKIDIQKIISKFKSFKKEGEVVAAFFQREVQKSMQDSSAITVQYFTGNELGEVY